MKQKKSPRKKAGIREIHNSPKIMDKAAQSILEMEDERILNELDDMASKKFVSNMKKAKSSRKKKDGKFVNKVNKAIEEYQKSKTHEPILSKHQKY
jgi:ribosomal protein L22